MSVISKIVGGIKRMFGMNDVRNIISIKPVISAEMSNAIQLWTRMYEGKSPWLKNPKPGDPEKIVSMGLPSLIASEKARMATLEMESEITAPMIDIEEENPDYEPPGFDENGMPTLGSGSQTITETVPIGPTEKADFMNKQYKKLLDKLRPQVEYGIAKGGLVIKPYVVFYEDSTISNSGNNVPDSGTAEKEANEKVTTPNNESDGKSFNSEEPSENDQDITKDGTDRASDELPKAEIEFDFIQADCFYPLAFDSNGKITEAAFLQTTTDKDKVYTRVEHHVLIGRSVTINNYAFVSNNSNIVRNGLVKQFEGLGKPCKLSEVPEWAGLEETVTIDEVDRPLFAYFKMPDANIIDTHSPLGVSGFARATGLIRDADEQYSRLLWEYEGGELAIDVDRNALVLSEMEYQNDTTLQTTLPAKQQRLFRRVDLNSEETYNVYAPPLRDESIIRGLNTILTRIEDACGISRGTLSEVASIEAKTATEMKILKQRTFSSNKDIQTALENALRDVIYIMDVYCDMYALTPDGEYEVSFEWDDSILTDSETELEKRMQMLNAGITSKVELRMWYFGETENQAKAALQKVDDEKKSSMETNIMAQQELGGEAQGKDFSGDNNNPDPQNPGNAGAPNFGKKTAVSNN